MSKAPAFQFYPDDYLGDSAVELMTLEEQGAYMRLLCHAWKQPEPGVVPADDAWLAGVTRLRRRWVKSKEAIARAFDTTSKSGWWIQKRMVREAIKQAEWRKKSSEGGQKSAELRAKGGSTTVEAQTSPPVEPLVNTPVSSLQTTSKPLAAAPPPVRKSHAKRERKPREPNDLWDVIAELFYGGKVFEPDESLIGLVSSTLKAYEATPAEVHRRFKAYKSEWPDVALTPQALMHNWRTFDPPTAGVSVGERAARAAELLKQHETARYEAQWGNRP